MIVNSSTEQINEITYQPLILVKAGALSKIFTNGVIDLSKVKNLKLPNARYDYMLRVYTNSSNGFQLKNLIPISCKQSNVDLAVNQFGYIEAELITTEI